MRAPSEATGSFALETALDELVAHIGLDPVELRVRNLARDRDPQTGLRWSSNHLDWCLCEGARAFDWKGGNRYEKGDIAWGSGMAVATYPGYRLPASCRASVRRDGKIGIETAAHEIGNGLQTGFAQLAADAVGVDLEAVVFVWGDSTLPPAPPTVGSMTTASVGSAVRDACARLRDTILKRVTTDRASALYGADPKALRIEAGAVTDGTWHEDLAVIAARWPEGPAVDGHAAPDPKPRWSLSPSAPSSWR